VPAFYLGDPDEQTVVEYASDARLNSQPLRTVNLHGAFVGVDRSGRLYSYTSRNPSGSGPCSINVQSSTGILEYRIKPARCPAQVDLKSIFVDPSGNIYFVLRQVPPAWQIVELPQGARGVNPVPMRTIYLPGVAMGNETSEPIPFELVATAEGEIYLSGPYRLASVAYYVFSQNAHGNSRPVRTIVRPIGGPISGVDSDGNAWSYSCDGVSSACAYGPTAQGKAQPRLVPLAGAPGGIVALAIASGDRIVYDAIQADQSSAVLRVSDTNGNLLQSIKMPELSGLYETRLVTASP
jgi:hypothetical protein